MRIKYKYVSRWLAKYKVRSGYKTNWEQSFRVSEKLNGTSTPPGPGGPDWAPEEGRAVRLHSA